MRSALALLLITLPWCAVGCGPGETIMPSGQFTEEQKAAGMAEYQKVEDEESMGNNKKFKKATKR